MAKSKENIIMNNENLGFDLNQYRASLEGFAPFFGKKIFQIKCDNLDLLHNEKVLKDQHPRLARPFKKFFIESIEITGMRVTKNANDKIVVEFNGQTALQFPVTAPKFEKPSSDKIDEAIKNPDANIFFTDYKELIKAVTALNKQTMEDIDALSKDLISWQSALRTINEHEQFEADRYFKSLDRK